MKYEFKKLLCNPAIWCIIIVALITNWILILRVCRNSIAYDLTEQEWMSNYAQIVKNANENISSEINVEYNHKVVKSFSNREIKRDAFYTNEGDYLEYSFSAMLSLFIIAIIAIKLVEDERNNQTANLLSTSANRTIMVGFAKIATLIIMSIAIVLVFEVENIVLFSYLGGVDARIPIYRVPGFIYSWNLHPIGMVRLDFGAIILSVSIFIGILGYMLSLICCNRAITVLVTTVAGEFSYGLAIKDRYRLYQCYDLVGISTSSICIKFIALALCLAVICILYAREKGIR